MFKRYLKNLTARENVEVHNEKLHYDTTKGISWMNVLNTYMPAPTPEPGRNDLLVLADLTVKSFKNPSRIWAALVGHSLIDRGHFSNWTVRTLMTLPPDDAEFVIPRSVIHRRKVSMLTEAYARHAVVVAETDNSKYVSTREFELATASANMVAQRAAANNIKTPENRIRPALESTKEVPAGPQGTTYVPQAPIYAGYLAGRFAEMQKLHDEAYQRDPKSPEYKKRRKELTAARAQLMHHAKSVDESIKYAKHQLEIDSMERAMVEAKLDDPKGASADHTTTLDEMNASLVESKKKLDSTFNDSVILVSRTLPNYVDEYRMALGSTGDITGSNFLWDHRPYEPLYIQSDDIHPKGSQCSIMYIEPEDKQTLAERFAVDRAHDRPDEAVEIALSVIGSFGIRGRESLAYMLEKLFPGQSIYETIKTIPELFPYVPKQLLSSSSSSSSTPAAAESSSKDEDTITKPSIYDDFEYFPQQVNLRSLPTSVLLKLLKAYLKTAHSKSFLQVNRSLGGSATMYSLRSWVFDIQSKSD